MKYETRIMKLTVAPEGEPLFSEQATHVEIKDEAAGEFVEVMQMGGRDRSEGIMITREEWPAIRDAVERLLAECREEEK